MKRDSRVHNQTVVDGEIWSMSDILREALVKDGSQAPGQCVRETVV